MDSLLLHAMADRQRFKSLRHVVPQGMIAPDTQAMLAWFGVYYDAFPERNEIRPDELQSLVRLRSGAASPESVQLTLHLVSQLEHKPEQSALDGILAQMYELDLSGRVAAHYPRLRLRQRLPVRYLLAWWFSFRVLRPTRRGKCGRPVSLFRDSHRPPIQGSCFATPRANCGRSNGFQICDDYNTQRAITTRCQFLQLSRFPSSLIAGSIPQPPPAPPAVAPQAPSPAGLARRDASSSNG